MASTLLVPYWYRERPSSQTQQTNPTPKPDRDFKHRLGSVYLPLLVPHPPSIAQSITPSPKSKPHSRSIDCGGLPLGPVAGSGDVSWPWPDSRQLEFLIDSTEWARRASVCFDRWIGSNISIYIMPPTDSQRSSSDRFEGRLRGWWYSCYKLYSLVLDHMMRHDLRFHHLCVSKSKATGFQATTTIVVL